MPTFDEFEDRLGDLGAFIRNQRTLAKMSLRHLSELSGISNPYLSQIERGLRKPSAEILQQVAKGLRISAEQLYVRAGLLADEPRSSPEGAVVEAISLDPWLDEAQKQSMLRIYASFRSERTADRSQDDGGPRSGQSSEDAGT
ncbi:MAG: helix-turn-helix domain-containing protein [Acidimicrobiia bacterium]